MVIVLCAALVRRPLLRMSRAVSSKALVSGLLFAFALLAFVVIEHLDWSSLIQGLGSCGSPHATLYHRTSRGAAQSVATDSIR